MRTSSNTLALATELRKAVTQLAARARAERTGSLTITQVAVLGRVAVEGPITPRELADRLRMLPQSLTRPLAQLESSGLVLRTPDPTDGRGALIEVTEAGLAELRAEMAPRNRWLARAIAAECTAEELAALAVATPILHRLAASDGIAPVEP